MKSIKSYILQYIPKAAFTPGCTRSYTVNTFLVTFLLLGRVLLFSAGHLLICINFPSLWTRKDLWPTMSICCITNVPRKPSEGPVSQLVRPYPWTGEKMDSDPKDLLPEFKAAPVQEHEKRTDKGISFVFCKREGGTNQGMNKNHFSHFFRRQTWERQENHGGSRGQKRWHFKSRINVLRDDQLCWESLSSYRIKTDFKNKTQRLTAPFFSECVISVHLETC